MRECSDYDPFEVSSTDYTVTYQCASCGEEWTEELPQ